MQDAGNILVVDDDVEFATNVCDFLTTNNFHVTLENTGEGALLNSRACPPQLIILDLVLPDIDGLAVCRSIRSHFFGPIIILTTSNDDIDEVAGLETGADEYLNKAIRPRVLLAHIRALMRRCAHVNADAVANDCRLRRRVEIGRIVADPGTREVFKNGHLVDFTTAEFDLLWLLISHAGYVLERDRIHRALFRLDYDGLDRTIDLRVSHIRRKLEDDPKVPRLIKTVRGTGYLFSAFG